jgi:phage shock protein A
MDLKSNKPNISDGKKNGKSIITFELVFGVIAVLIIVNLVGPWALLLFIPVFIINSLKKKNKELLDKLNDLEIWKTEINQKYEGIIDVEEEKRNLNKNIEDLKTTISNLNTDQNQLQLKKAELEKEIALLSEENDLLDYGFYEFQYDYEKSEKYNEALEDVKQEQKELIKNKEAAICETEWKVNNSKQEGKKVTDNILKLALRAFNGESDSAIAKVKFNNVHVMENRINKSFESINKMILHFHCRIIEEYRDLKIEELHLTYEYYKVLETEKEEQRRIKEQMREEERAQKELERARLEAEKEEERTRKALERAEAKLKSVHGEELAKLQEQIEALNRELEQAKNAKDRATSMAQLTKSGYVYVISNIGSFGENVYKIGMTRRLEPMDRVRELGDASVPFNFDVHAMIFSENAPELENALHKEFYDFRVNKINDRREFFRVKLEDIKRVAERYKADVKFTMIAEAEQYRQTLAIEREMNKK